MLKRFVFMSLLIVLVFSSSVFAGEDYYFVNKWGSHGGDQWRMIE